MNPAELSMTEGLMALYLLSVLAGIFLAWGKKGLGGAMMVGVMILFYSINFIGSGKFPGGWIFPILYISGILFLICWFAAKRKNIVE